MNVAIKLMPNLKSTQKMLPLKKNELISDHCNPIKLWAIYLQFMDPASQAYTEDCLGWKCTICGLFAKDQVELEMQLIENEKKVLSENDNRKWVRCKMCLCLHLYGL